MLRFHIPLIKPGGPFSGTRLSDKVLLHILLHTFAHERLPLRSWKPVQSPLIGTDVGRGTVLFPDPAP
jgi:hypothetical protein